jgi:hypothetical protein
VKITQFARADATGKTPVKTGWPSFFGNFVRVTEQRFDLSCREVLQLQKYRWWDIRTQFLFSEVNGSNKFIQ